MRIEVLEEAKRDLIEGFHFYENQEAGLGLYFRTNLFADIERLKNHAGIHSKPYKSSLSRFCVGFLEAFTKNVRDTFFPTYAFD